MDIRAVWFDVGETLVDEAREYGAWADWIGVPRHTFSAVFGAVLARGGDHRETFAHFRPGFDVAAERERRIAAGAGEYVTPDDLYDDARPALAALRDSGLFVGVAGNQTRRAGPYLRELGLPADVVATSDDWGVEKPSPDFFRKMGEVSGHPASEILYVGDRMDNDITPAAGVGMRTALVRRGPWAAILDPGAYPERPTFVVDSLAELPELVRP